ncbi:hypothetical protein BJ138DRAFT_1107068, partial [Hygrophoropsis aurantiaca]
MTQALGLPPFLFQLSAQSLNLTKMQNDNDVTVIGRGEDTPLLGKKTKKPRTPLPKVQLGILMFLQLAEPISSMCIYPFINQLVRELNITGGDETKVGYYVGLIGFSLIPIVWCAGATIGPFMGGALARPHEQFPETFSGAFWEQYPYFLPCAAAAAFTAGTFLLILFFLKETLPSRVVRVQKAQVRSSSQLDAESMGEGTSPNAVHSTMMPLRSLLIPSVIIPLANYGMLAFVELALLSLQPLYYSTPTALGGLGFSPSLIGSWVALFGFMNGAFQALFFAPIVDRLGLKRMFMISVTCFLPIFMIFPVMSWH